MLSAELLDELNAYCNVQVESDLALVAIIGNNLHAQSGVAKNYSTLLRITTFA